MYINCVDCEKAFDSLDREALWKCLQHYGIADHFISLIRCMLGRLFHGEDRSEAVVPSVTFSSWL